MENTGLIQHVDIQFLFPDLSVCSRLPCKRKRPLAILTDRHKCKCCKIILIQEHSFCFYLLFFQHITQKFSMHIFSCFAKKCRARTKFCRCNGYICRSSSGISRIQRLTVRIFSLWGKIDQDFPECSNIINGTANGIIGVHQKRCFQKTLQNFITFRLIVRMNVQFSCFKFRQTQHAKHRFRINRIPSAAKLRIIRNALRDADQLSRILHRT